MKRNANQGGYFQRPGYAKTPEQESTGRTRKISYDRSEAESKVTDQEERLQCSTIIDYIADVEVTTNIENKEGEKGKLNGRPNKELTVVKKYEVSYRSRGHQRINLLSQHKYKNQRKKGKRDALAI